MIHRKLDATDSTNSFLRELMRNEQLQSWTVVSTEQQLAGRGQQGASWFSDSSKNLTFSILIKEEQLKAKHQFLLNCAVSIGIYKALNRYGVPRLKVKWPNDIMSGTKKLAGILIENSVMNENIAHTIVGIGLNVNQESFPKDLPAAVSLQQLLKTKTNRDELLTEIVTSIKSEFQLVREGEGLILRSNYQNLMYRINAPHMYRIRSKQQIIGKILGVSDGGLLILEKEDESVSFYGFKEIEYL